MAGLPLVGDEFAGYRVRSVLGRGGMSVVYQAENLRLSSIIALKVLAPELASDDVFRARFLEESRIAASLNHPNVIPIYDMGSQDDLLYIAMRYVSGTDMRQMIKKRGRILPATALFLVGQAARALDAAHRKGLVHRDVKPGNLLIERGSDDADPDHVYLADFGITKHAMSRSGLTSTGQFLGTIDYVRAGADPRHVGARPGRSVLAGLRAVRVPDRAGPVREGPRRGDHLGARRGDAHDADDPAPRTAAGDRPGIRPGAGASARTSATAAAASSSRPPGWPSASTGRAPRLPSPTVRRPPGRGPTPRRTAGQERRRASSPGATWPAGRNRPGRSWIPSRPARSRLLRPRARGSGAVLGQPARSGSGRLWPVWIWPVWLQPAGLQRATSGVRTAQLRAAAWCGPVRSGSVRRDPHVPPP